MKTAIALVLTLVALSAFAEEPGQLAVRVESRVASALVGCGLELLDGQDLRLPYANVRSKNPDMVVTKKVGNRYVPGLLIDRDGRNDGVSLSYSRADNGHVLLTLARDYDMNDLYVTTDRFGTVAYSRSYTRSSPVGGINETAYYVMNPVTRRQGEVSAEIFARYLDEVVADDFAKMVCDEAATLK